MFSYYGSKYKLVNHYPEPQYDTIVEPFAGAAWYSLKWSDRNVILNDKYATVYNLWKWLIEEATPDEILAYTDFYAGEDVSSLSLRQEHKDLIGFSINRGSASPRNIVQGWSCQVKARPKWASTTSYALKRAASYLEKIRHWEVCNLEYYDLPDIEATWFIDPPYQYGGNRYAVNGIDYDRLYEWGMSRRGQVIICENTKADWIQVEPISTITGQRHKTTEGFWTREKDVTEPFLFATRPAQGKRA